MQYDTFMNKYAAYEDKYMEKRAFIETLLPAVAEHMPSVLAHAPEGALGLAGTAAKYLALRGVGRGAKALMEARTLSRRFGGGINEGLKLRGTPQGNLALGKFVAPKSTSKGKILSMVDKGTDVASVGYNAVLLGKHLI